MKITPRANFTILNKQMTQINTAERLAAKSFFGLFYKVTTNCNPTKPYHKSLINLVCSVCTGQYCLWFLSHRPRSFVARSVRKTSGNTILYRPPTRLISHYYYCIPKFKLIIRGQSVIKGSAAGLIFPKCVSGFR